MQDFMSMATSRFNGTFFDGKDHNKLITKAFATNIIERPQISSLLNSIFQDAYTPESKERIINSIEKISFLGYLRIGLSFFAYKFSYVLPGISDGLKLALTSTYSFGPGMIYGIVFYGIHDYDSFMSRILWVTIFIFHFSVLLLYLLLVKLKIKSPVALFISLMMLFSISFYSYGYHPGSTIWNVFTMMIFLYYMICAYEHRNFYKNISKLTAVLVFFNYLIVFPRFALMLYKFYGNFITYKMKKYDWKYIKQFIFKLLKSIFYIIKEQKVALICMAMCGILFFDSNATKYLVLARESGHGFWQFFINLYYIILNFLSIYAGNNLIDSITFIASFGLILFGYIYMFQNKIKYPKRINHYLKILVGILLVIFSFRILVFIPTRHILWLAPLVFIPIAVSIDRIVDYIGRYRFICGIIFIMFVGFGCYSVFDRSLKTYDIILKQNFLYVSPYNTTLVLDVYGSKFGYTNKYGFLEKTTKIRKFLHPSDNFFSLVSLSEIEKGKKYFYISQMSNFSGRLQGRSVKNIKYKTYNEKIYFSDVYFIANNKGSGSPYVHTFPNTFYVGEFELLK
ncbi:MAG: hypothetical protein WC872_02475 [Candidatus Absconditabacterales bacterium]